MAVRDCLLRNREKRRRVNFQGLKTDHWEEKSRDRRFLPHFRIALYLTHVLRFRDWGKIGLEILSKMAKKSHFVMMHILYLPPGSVNFGPNSSD